MSQLNRTIGELAENGDILTHSQLGGNCEVLYRPIFCDPKERAAIRTGAFGSPRPWLYLLQLWVVEVQRYINCVGRYQASGCSFDLIRCCVRQKIHNNGERRCRLIL